MQPRLPSLHNQCHLVAEKLHLLMALQRRIIPEHLRAANSSAPCTSTRPPCSPRSVKSAEVGTVRNRNHCRFLLHSEPRCRTHTHNAHLLSFPAPTSFLLNDNIHSLLLSGSLVSSLLPGIPIPAFLLAPSREIQRGTHCSMASFLSPGSVLCAPSCCIFPALLSVFWPHPIDTSHELHADKMASFPHHFLIKLSDTG